MPRDAGLWQALSAKASNPSRSIGGGCLVTVRVGVVEAFMVKEWEKKGRSAEAGLAMRFRWDTVSAKGVNLLAPLDEGRSDDRPEVRWTEASGHG